jgi:hypothetical protein
MMSPRAIRDHLQENGYRALLKDEDQESSTIETGAGGLTFYVTFWRSEPFDGDLDRFEELHFLALAEADGDVSFEKVNEANANNRFVRVFRDQDSVFFDMDVAITSEALTSDLFDASLAAWTNWLPDTVQEVLG